MVTPPPSRLPLKPPGIALALGGGAFHGAAHIGVIKALEEHKIPIGLVIGVSSGSIVGALYADRGNAGSLLQFVHTKANEIFDFSLFRSKAGFISGKKLQRYILQNCAAKNIEDMHIPFGAVTTDLVAGKSVVLTSGPLAPAVNASCAIPFVFEPVKMYGTTFVDGGVLNNVPADVCRDMGATLVIAVDIMTFDTSTGLDSMLKILMRSLAVASSQFKTDKLARADVLIVPDLNGIPYLSGARNQDAYDSGYAATIKLMPQIREMMTKYGIAAAAVDE